MLAQHLNSSDGFTNAIKQAGRPQYKNTQIEK